MARKKKKNNDGKIFILKYCKHCDKELYTMEEEDRGICDGCQLNGVGIVKNCFICGVKKVDGMKVDLCETCYEKFNNRIKGEK